MKASEKLLIAKKLLELNLSDKISQISIDLTYKQLRIVLIDGIQVYIVYNDHEEYSYSVIFSKLDLDRCRFDNYDVVGKFPLIPIIFILERQKKQLKAQ